MKMTWSIQFSSLISPSSPSLVKSTPITHVKNLINNKPSNPSLKSMATAKQSMSPSDSRVSLVFALANQAANVSQRLFMELATETAKYVFPSNRFESRSFEEALMSVPNLETVEFKVLSRNNHYEIRQVEAYFIAETTMPGKYGFEFAGSSQSFNVLAEYLFGKNTGEKQMEMTTPVFTRKTESKGKRMDMTTPVLTTRVKDQGTWVMSFVMPSKYGPDLPLPKNSSITIREVPKKIVAAVAFSGFVTDEEVNRRESALRELLKNDRQFCVKEDASVEVAQYNPPFTLPFNRRNEISLEVEWRQT